MYRVEVMQGKNVTRFGFDQLCDAVEFASECMEVGDEGTEVNIKKDKEET